MGRRSEDLVRKFGPYRAVYTAIRDKAPNALEDFKHAVAGMDWGYRMSDDPHSYAQGEWQEQTLTALAKMLGTEAEKWFAREKRQKLVP